MTVFHQLAADTQRGYEGSVAAILNRVVEFLGEDIGEVSKADFPAALLARTLAAPHSGAIKLALLHGLTQLCWWCDLKLSDADEAMLAAAGRTAMFSELGQLPRVCAPWSPDARFSHAIVSGDLVTPLHSPTRGLFDYALALARDPKNRRVDVYVREPLSPELSAYAQERLGEHFGRVRFLPKDPGQEYLVNAIGLGPTTFHIWCEQAFDMSITMLSLFGPTVMFTCGDAAPIQFADVYWYCHTPQYIQGLWRRRGAPERFISNYRQAQSAPFDSVPELLGQQRHEFGLAEDDKVIVTVGNRLGIDMDQSFVDGMALRILGDSRVRWVMVGPLQEFWLGAFQQVLGRQFVHIDKTKELPTLFALCDVFANPFRAGGGTTAIMSVDSGAPVLTRGDLGDVPAFVPQAHHAPSAQAYFERLDELLANPALRAAWLAEQQALLAVRLDQDLFVRELGELCDLAQIRYGRRGREPLDALLDQPLPKLKQLKAAGRRARLR